MTKTGSNDTEEPADESTQPKKGLGLSPVQVIAGGGAAAVASVIGGHLGLAGTVVGAFILSIVSGIALPLFRASLEKSHERIKRVVPRRATAAARTTHPQMAADTAGIIGATSGKVSATSLPLEHAWQDDADARNAPCKAARGRTAWMAIGGTATVFAIGMGSVLGIQSATGVSLSHGTSALQSGISQVVLNVKDGKGTPATDPKPAAPAVEPSNAPTDPATDPAEDPTEQPTEQPAATPTPTSEPAPSAEPTAPGGTDNPVPSRTPDPAAGTSDGSSGAAGSQAQPVAGTSTGNAPAK